MRWYRSLLRRFLVLVIGLSAAGISAENLPFIHKKRYAMGTVYEIVAYDRSVARASAAIDKALDEVIRLDNVMSNFKPESELSRMNRNAHFRSIRISADLYKVIEESLGYSRLSDGEFDVSVGPVVDLWKAAIEGGPVPTEEDQAKARSCVGYQKIKLTPPDHIEFRSPCIRLDLGSIGKGYAVDRVAEILRAGGVERAYINAGGSTLYGLGTPPEYPGWTVHLRDPSNRLDPQVSLTGNSVSTSEQTAPSVLGGDAPGHIVVPVTGKPLRSSYAVSVVAKSATASDALSTTLLLLGPEKGKALVESLSDVAAIWVAADGQKTIVSTGPLILLGNESPSNGNGSGAERISDKSKAELKRR